MPNSFVLLFSVICINCASGYNNLETLKSLEIQSTDKLMEFIAQESYDEMNLCQKHSQLYLEERKSLTGWAFRMFDATAKLPDGLLGGNNHPVGAIHECMDVETPSLLNWNGSVIEGFKGQFMGVFFIVQERSGRNKQPRMPIFLPDLPPSVAEIAANDLRMGLCVPSSCNKDEIGMGLYVALNPPDSDSKYITIPYIVNNLWEDKEIHLDSGDKGFIALCAIILIGIFLGTLMEVWFIVQGKMSNNVEPPSNLQKFLLNFGLYGNTKRLLDTNPPKGDHLACLDGLRFVSITWVMLGHGLQAEISGFPITNTLFFTKVYNRFEFQAVNNAFVSVDTFFLMSGCLVAYLMFKELDKTKGHINYPILYLHRYLRITGSYAFIIFFLSTVWKHCDSGPFHYWELEADACSKASWINLLYVNNFELKYLEDQQSCLGQTWYLANDMQMFLIAPPIIYITWRWRKIGLTLIGILTAASAAIPAGLTYKHGWGVSPFFPGNENYMVDNYVKPWCRFSPYIVGIYLGYLLHNTKGKPFKMSKVTNLWGWVIAIATGLAIVYGLNIPKFASGEREEFSMAENILYGGFHRLAWAIAVAWVIFTCCRGYGGWINELLSWSAFMPLSKISFIMYLVHMNLENYIFGLYPSNTSLNVTTGVLFELGIIGYTAILSSILYICIELPWLNTEKFIFGMILRPRNQRKRIE